MSAQVYDLTVRLKGNNASYNSALKGAAKQNKNFEQSVGGISKGLTAIEGPLNGVAGRFSALSPLISGSAGLWAGLGAAVAGVSLIMAKAIGTASEYETSHLKMEALVKATGYAAGFTASQLETQADAVALATLASVEGIREAQGVLLTFKSVQGETFNEAIRLSQDMAAVFGGTAKDKALQLGKALESPTDGLNALKRSGVSFTEEQKKLIKSLDESGEKAKAQELILKELRGQIGGAANAQAGGLAGSVDTLSQSWDEFKLALVSSTDADTAAKGLLDGIATRLRKLNEMLNPSNEKRFNDLLAQRIKLQQELDSMEAGKARPMALAYKRAELRAINDEMRQLQDLRKQEIIDEAAAADASAKAGNKAAGTSASDFFGYSDTQIQAGLASIDQELATKEEREFMAAQRRQDMLDAALLADQLSETAWQEKSVALWQQYHDKRAEMEAEATEKRVAEEEKAAKALAQTRQEQVASLNTFNSNVLSVLQSAGKEQSGLYKLMFAAQKAAAIPSMIVDTEKAATSAMALMPGPAGIAMGGVIRGVGYASIGMVAGQTLAGIAHGGLGYVPEEATYLLQKGEGVLSPKQNTELSAAAERINNGQSGSIVVNLVEDSTKAGSVERETGPSREEILTIFVESIRYGTEAAQELESRYQMSRTA